MKKMVLSLVTTIAISAVSLSAADTVYATVNGENITKADVAVVLRNPKIKFDTLPKDTKDRVIQQVIEKKLLTVKAIESGVEKTTSFKKAIDKIKKDLALEIWMQEEFKKLKVSDAEKKAFYKENELKFKKQATLEARHILVKKEETAKSIIKDLETAKDAKVKLDDNKIIIENTRVSYNDNLEALLDLNIDTEISKANGKMKIDFFKISNKDTNIFEIRDEISTFNVDF